MRILLRDILLQEVYETHDQNIQKLSVIAGWNYWGKNS